MCFSLFPVPLFHAGNEPMIPIFLATLAAKSSEYSVPCAYLLNRNWYGNSYPLNYRECQQRGFVHLGKKVLRESCFRFGEIPCINLYFFPLHLPEQFWRKYFKCVVLAYAIKPATSNCQVSKTYQVSKNLFIVIHYSIRG